MFCVYYVDGPGGGGRGGGMTIIAVTSPKRSSIFEYVAFTK